MVIARTQTLVQLTDELIALLDAKAARDGVSRSALIRDAVAAYLHDDEEAAIDAAIIEGYRRMPQIGVDAWGDFEAQMEFLSREAMARLDPWPQEDFEEGGPGEEG